MKWFAQHLRKSTSDLSKYLEWIIANLHLCASQFKLKAFSFVFRFSFPLPGNFSLEVDEESLDVEHEKSTFISYLHSSWRGKKKKQTMLKFNEILSLRIFVGSRMYIYELMLGVEICAATFISNLMEMFHIKIFLKTNIW